MTVLGLHHITLGCSDAQKTIDFYVGVLGLRFVKRTVNFDDPTTYHLYFGDELGNPGTAVTFFEWGRMPHGHPGVGGTHHFALGVKSGAGMLRWKRRLTDNGLTVDGPAKYDGLSEICFRDPDGVILKIVTEDASASGDVWSEPITEIDAEMALDQGMHHVTAISSNLERTNAFYSDLLGLKRISEGSAPDDPDPETRQWVWQAEVGQGRQIRYFEKDPHKSGRARIGVGQTHHFAFVVPDDDSQRQWRDRLLRAGIPVSPVMDRMYFKSIYTRDPDGHVMELATAGPGFAVDEDPAHLGEDLKLPPWLEADRPMIASALRSVTIPSQGQIR